MMDAHRTRLIRAAALALSLAIGVTACVAGPGAPGTGTVSGTSPGSSAGIDGSSPGGSPVPSPTPERSIPRVSPVAPPVDLTGLPDATVQAVLGDAAARTGVDAAAITFVRAEATTWPDGALGCPEPGHVYTQALVPGYWLVVDAGGQRLDYRATQRGGLKLCTNPPGPG